MSQIQQYQSDSVSSLAVVLAGIVTALELLNAGKTVTLVDAEPEDAFGGQANHSFWWSCSSLIPKSSDVTRSTTHPNFYCSRLVCAQCEFKEDDVLGGGDGQKNMPTTVKTDVYDWLLQHKISFFFPAVQWVEAG